MFVQLVTNSVVTNIEVVDDGSTVANGSVVTPGGVRTPPAGSTYMSQLGAGVGWILTNGVLVRPVPNYVYTKDQLLSYANDKQWGLATGGHYVTIEGTRYLFATDSVSQGLIAAKVLRFSQPNPPASVDWQLGTGFVTITASDFIAAATNIADWVQSTFDALKPVVDAINAGTITAPQQVDASMWPAP